MATTVRVTYREAVAEDVEAVSEVALETWEHDYPNVVNREAITDTVESWYDPDELAADVHRGDALVLVAERQDTVTGSNGQDEDTDAGTDVDAGDGAADTHDDAANDTYIDAATDTHDDAATDKHDGDATDTHDDDATDTHIDDATDTHIDDAATNEASDDVVGFLHGVVDGDCGTILRAYVHPDARGNGIGSGLIDAALDEFSNRGCERTEAMVLARNEPGNDFYDALGFEQVATDTTTIGGDGYDEHVYLKYL